MIGPGKYDKQLSLALKDCKAKQGFLLVVDGDKGPSFCAQLTYEYICKVPSMLRSIADQIEQGMEEAVKNDSI